MINIDNLIKEAIKSKDKIALDAYRAVKTAFLEYTTAKNAKPLDENAEISIIRKLVSQRKDAAEQYTTGNRLDLASKELSEIKYLKVLLPAEVSSEFLRSYAEGTITDKDKKLMGNYIKLIKDKFPTADGKVIADIVKEVLNS